MKGLYDTLEAREELAFSMRAVSEQQHIRTRPRLVQISVECNWTQYVRSLGVSGFVKLCSFNCDIMELTYMRMFLDIYKACCFLDTHKILYFEEFLPEILQKYETAFAQIGPYVSATLGEMWFEDYMRYRHLTEELFCRHDC